MKLTKAKLLNKVRERLIRMGYNEMRDTITAAEGLFIKRLPPVFYLSLGFTISRFYESRFTAAYYLSKTTLWAATWGDIPQEAYKRVGVFLSSEERALYLDAEYGIAEGSDAWWSGDKDQDIFNFLETIRLSESRFLGQDNLFQKVESSVEVKELVDHVLGVFEIIDKGENDKYEYQFIPEKKQIIPIEWFKAAEVALKNKGGILNKNTVMRLAADAWRQRNIK